MENQQLDLFRVDSNQEARNIDPIEQKIHFLALSNIRGIGFQTLRKIYKRYKRFDSAWLFSDVELHQLISNISYTELKNIVANLRSNKDALVEKATNEFNTFHNRNIGIIFQFEPHFPKNLLEIPDSPYWLFMEGSQDLLSRDNLIAIVGSRVASDNGIKAARKISSILSELKIPIVSGLAEGIDAVAQQTAVDFGNQCIAVLGTGISVVFPSSTAILRSRILQSGGTIVTEYLPNDSYSKSRFVQRNRIQAAMSRIIIPVEWSIKGGTAHTIRYAEKYKKPVVFVRGLKDQTLENDSNLYTSSNNRYFIDANSALLGNEMAAILHDLHISILPPSQQPLNKSNDVFRSLIDEFNRLVSSYNINEADYNRLIRDIKNKWVNRGNTYDR
ncbi:DNA-processing protein DprA [Chloroflexota bacterium]